MQDLSKLGKLAYRRKEAAMSIGVSPRKIDYWIKEGKLKAQKIDGCVLIPYCELLKIIEVK